MPSLVRAYAPSKVNLALSVGAPDASGMHPIASWMVTTRFGDDLTLKRLPLGTPSRYAIEWHDDAHRKTDIDWKISKDLAVRAHRALEERLARELPVQLRLQKRIPVGGGLGGGSSDAGAMLRALDALFDLRLRPQFLEHLGAGLGSDVPFLVRGGSAIVEGLGERIERLPALPDLHAVLAFPSAPCPTGAVYGKFDLMRPDAALVPARVRELAAMASLAHDAPFNDLAAPAVAVEPVLEDDIAEVELATGRTVHVSGSGSTLFVLCGGRLEADLLAEQVRTRAGLPAVAASVRGL